MAEFNYELLDDRVVIQPDPTEEQTSSGLYLAKSAQRKSDKGTVIAVGGGYVARETGLLIPMFVKVGDRVIYTKSHCEEFEGYLLTTEASIKCVIKD